MKKQLRSEKNTKQLLSFLLGSSKHCYRSESDFSVSGFEKTGEIIPSGALRSCEIVRDEKQNTLYTLKTLSKSFLESTEATKEKIQKSIKLDHQNVLKVHFFLEDCYNFYVFYNYVPGDDLISEIFIENLLPKEKCLDYFYGICKGLDSLHSNGLILEHLSLENIYFDREHNAMIAIDFADKEPNRDCIAPEANPSYKSDIWCLGLIFYEMLHGYFPQNTREINKNLPLFADELLSKLLQEDPKSRLSSRRIIVHSYFNYKLDQSVIIDRIEKRILRSINRKKILRGSQSTNASENISTFEDN